MMGEDCFVKSKYSKQESLAKIMIPVFKIIYVFVVFLLKSLVLV